MQLIYKNGCWGCKRAGEDPQEKYTCPQYQQHQVEFEQQKNQEKWIKQ